MAAAPNEEEILRELTFLTTGLATPTIYEPDETA
ncbi:hypothetical protein CfE428DRAFT_3119 [Chthoniobacter flavus Ellin428]|uniref:Uncharacterized protein n=2 Tax=Chthoniobacter flavus TaxID=191863 RepID=B4D2J4_9BACT|nr:hypothetical protein CfE428DRAFT_3119 [Chthoniobacter flavus Ellin428]TCO90438.1 hypothetical protein EV701_11061 [Chthoniobacter flavus]